MKCRHGAWYALGLLAGVFGAGVATAQAGPSPFLFRSSSPSPQWEKQRASAQLPLEQIHPTLRLKMQRVLDNPTLHTQGPAESFVCDPMMYKWLLDNPDRTMWAWRRLGAKCLEITNKGNGRFNWVDGKGSDVTWFSVYPGANLRVWYAEGQVKPGALLPTVSVQCVAVLRHDVVRAQDGGALIQHQVEVFVYTDSRAATLVTRILGPSVPRLAEQGAAQMQMFFAALAWYCHQHPDQIRGLFQPPGSDTLPSQRINSPLEASPVIFPTGNAHPGGW